MICNNISLFKFHFWLRIYRIRNALLLDSIDTVKQPSLSVNPDNQESLKVGSTVVRIGMIRGNTKEPRDM